jgi:hypothetical protein
METSRRSEDERHIPLTFTLGSLSKRPSGTEKREISIDPEDLIALGVLVLAIAAAMTALLVAVLWGTGRVEAVAATKVILGRVGGAAVSSVVAAMLRKRKKGK